jgi:hypothetical protein
MQTTPRKPSSCLDFKNQGKKSAKTRKLGFLETTVHRVGETAENQRKTREKSKVTENQVFWLDFCAKKNNCAYPLRKTWLSAFSYAQSYISMVFFCFLGFLVTWFSPLQLSKIWRIFCVMYGEEGGWTLFICLQKLYLTDMFEWLLCYIQL